jgi:hypothetical protein
MVTDRYHILKRKELEESNANAIVHANSSESKEDKDTIGPRKRKKFGPSTTVPSSSPSSSHKYIDWLNQDMMAITQQLMQGK